MQTHSYHSEQVPQSVTVPVGGRGVGNGKVRLTVCCRVRPVIPVDYKQGTTKRNAPEICVHCSQDGQSIKLIQDHLHSKDVKLDHSFDTAASQQDVYKLALRPIVKDCIQGYHGTCFVYGQTSSGKTYTMFGSEDKLGITHLALNEIFDAVQQYEQEDLIAKVFLSFYQIYTENIYDLLASTGQQKGPVPLNLRNEGEASFQVEGLQQVYVKTRDMAFQVISQGLQQRVVHSNTHNIRSSRSHAILQVHLDFEERVENSNGQDRKASSSSSTYNRNGNLVEKKYLVRRRTLTLVDLAGSERVVSYRQSAKQQLLEAGMINKSLAALGNCIHALSNREQQSDPTLHVPYRDCKLTCVLAEALGGNCKTCIITTISPCLYNYEETLSTLKFASRAKVVKKFVKKPRAEEFQYKTDIVPYLQPLEEEGEEEYEQSRADYYPPPPQSAHRPPLQYQAMSSPYTQSQHPIADQYAYQGYPMPMNQATQQQPLQHYPNMPPARSNGSPPPPPPGYGASPHPMSSSGPSSGFKPFAFEKPSQTFNLRDFLQACTVATKAFDPRSEEQYGLPPSSITAPDDLSMSTHTTGTPYAHSYPSHPSKIETAVEVIPDEIDAYNRFLQASAGSRLHIDTNEGSNMDDSPGRKGKMSTADFQFQTEDQSSKYSVRCHKGVQTWSMTPSAMEGKAFDGTLDDFGSIKPPSKMDQMTEIDDETLMYTTNSIQDPTQRDELLKLAKLSPMELVCSLAELRNAVFQLSEAVSCDSLFQIVFN